MQQQGMHGMQSASSQPHMMTGSSQQHSMHSQNIKPIMNPHQHPNGQMNGPQSMQYRSMTPNKGNPNPMQQHMQPNQPQQYHQQQMQGGQMQRQMHPVSFIKQ